MSVARSPLKHPEDFLVGQSVVFSAEAVMRTCGNIPHGAAVGPFIFLVHRRKIAQIWLTCFNKE